MLENLITYNSISSVFVDGFSNVDFFKNLVVDFDSLGQKDQWRFIKVNNSETYNVNYPGYMTIINENIIEKLSILSN